VARWTHTASEFGAQYDSIADMVAFGVAPAAVAYEWALKDLGTAGWIAAFVYCAAAGIRLARFNVNIGVVDKRYFQGLPSPSGAAVMTGLVWMLDGFDLVPEEHVWIAGVTWLVAVFAGLTMVSNLPFYSFKEFNWKRRVPLWVILAAVIAYALVATRPSLILFALFFAYALSGYVLWASGRRGRSVLPDD
jgi:CDP-diacylglycerol--serine O-phosphatidyltransferase